MIAGAARGIAIAVLIAPLMVGLASGCPDKSPPPASDSSAASPPAAGPGDADFRREAHAKALATLRERAMPALRQLDPVAASQVEDAPLRPPGFGASARVAVRDPLTQAQRDASGIQLRWLAPESRVVLRAHLTGLDRGLEHLRRPPWRDDPRGVLYALEPYLSELSRRVAAGDCEDGCGIEALGPALRSGFDEVGSAPPPTVPALREDLATLATALERFTAELPATHALVLARPRLEATLTEIDAELGRAAEALPTAEELPWASVAPRAAPEAWKRRPPVWGPKRLQEWLQTEEAYGHGPRAIFEQTVAAATRLGMMIERDGSQADSSQPIPRPFDETGCRAGFEALRVWIEAQQTHLVATLDCTALVRELGPEPGEDAEIIVAMLDRGVIDPTRLAQVRTTGSDIAMIRGRAAPFAQRLTLEVVIAAGSGHRKAELRVLSEAHRSACLAATAVWVHGELGSAEALGARLGAVGCGDTEALVAATLARPRAALEGLGLVLLGRGPADAAALDRYWWAPMGLVRDLALPPVPPPETPPSVHIEEL